MKGKGRIIFKLTLCVTIDSYHYQRVMMRHYKWERALRRTQVTVRWWRGRQIGFPDVFDEGESTVV